MRLVCSVHRHMASWLKSSCACKRQIWQKIFIKMRLWKTSTSYKFFLRVRENLTTLWALGEEIFRQALCSMPWFSWSSWSVDAHGKNGQGCGPIWWHTLVIVHRNSRGNWRCRSILWSFWVLSWNHLQMKSRLQAEISRSMALRQAAEDKFQGAVGGSTTQPWNTNFFHL